MKRFWSVVGVTLALLVPSMARADFQITCPTCVSVGNNRTVNLLMRKSAADPVTLQWTSLVDPTEGSKLALVLYAGNPSKGDAIPDRGELTFQPEGGKWVAQRTFPAEEVGHGTFLCVVTARKRQDRSNDKGTNEQILDWRPLRLLTKAQLTEKEKLPPAESAHSIDVIPALLQVDTGHGALPRHDGGPERVWWITRGTDGALGDLDLDGAASGAAGLGVQVSSVWETRGNDANWKDKVLGLATGVKGHRARFEDMQWYEVPDRPIDTGKTVLDRKYFYTAVTLYSRATVQTFDKRQLIEPSWHPLNEKVFSHETTARIGRSRDPRFWASYSQHEYGKDTKLLRILSRQVHEGVRVPGLSGLQTDDGNGGDATYNVGFYVYVRPWNDVPDPKGTKPEAGLIAVDVVAARRGIGGIQAAGGSDSVLCQVVGCSDGNGPINLRDPPPGYSVANASVALNTLEGKVPLLSTPPLQAEKSLPPAGEPVTQWLPPAPEVSGFPTTARITLSAKMNAGALMRNELFWRVSEVTPIDVYTQYILKISVAAFPGAKMESEKEPTIPSRCSMGSTNTNTDNDPLGFFKQGWLLALLAVAAVAALVLGVLYVKGILAFPFKLRRK